MKKYLFILIGIFLIGLVSAVPTLNLEARTGQANTLFNYTLNFTSSSDCSGVLLSYSDDILTDSNGNYFFEIPISSLNQNIPTYLCEYKNGALRKTHEFSDLIFNSIRVKNITSNNIFFDYGNISSKLNPDGEESVFISSELSSDIQLGNGGYFNIRDRNGNYIGYIEESTGNLFIKSIYVNSSDLEYLGLEDGDIQAERIFSNNWSASDISIYDLSDVQDSANDLEFLQYNSTSGNWHPVSIATTYYNATTSQLVAGTLTGGTLNDTKHSDGNYDGISMNISEQAGGPGLDIRINFTGIDAFHQGITRYKTSVIVGALPTFYIYDYDDNDWEAYQDAVISTEYRVSEVSVFDDDAHISPTGVVQVRLYKPENGNTNNKYYFDWLSVAEGFGIPAGQEIDPLSIHKDGTTTWQGNDNHGDYNITNINNLIFTDAQKFTADANRIYASNIFQAGKIEAYNDADVTRVPLVVKGILGQTADLFTVRNSLANDLFSVDKDGQLIIDSVGGTIADFTTDAGADARIKIENLYTASTSNYALIDFKSMTSVQSRTAGFIQSGFSGSTTDATRTSTMNLGIYYNGAQKIPLTLTGSSIELGNDLDLNSNDITGVSDIKDAMGTILFDYTNYEINDFMGRRTIDLAANELVSKGNDVILDFATSNLADFKDNDIVTTGDLETDKIAVGSNTLTGLSSGDINVSTVYYDTLTAKSPMFMCSDNWCSVSFPKYQKTLWIQKDENYTILDIIYEDVSYTKQSFYQLVQGTQYEEIALKLNDKIKKLQDKSLCENQGYNFDGECFEIVRTITDYAGAVESYEKNLTEEYNCTKLNSQLQTYSTTCQRQSSVTETAYRFKEGCGWDGDYYCEVRELR